MTMDRKERDIITVFTLLDMEDYHDELQIAINTIIKRIPNFGNTYFTLWGEPYQDVDTFETEEEAKHFLLETIRGKKKFSKYTHFTLAIGEKYLEVV